MFKLFFGFLFISIFSCALFANDNGIDDGAKKAEAAMTLETAPIVKVDFAKKIGKIKELHGVNNSPVKYEGDIPEMREAGIPFARLHDAAGAFGGTHFVDIGNIFPDFDADPENPASYDFAFTDAYIKTLVNSGVKIFYRLGTTIENQWKIKAYTIYPPKDNLKWAKICEGIIRHYNEGWANGFNYNIEYWEIWNEPENPPMWQGTKEQFFELYATSAKYLKERFPNIKVGGYAGCGFYAVTRPNMSDFYKGFVTWFEDFLKFTKHGNIPLDFFSWHLYSDDPLEIGKHSEFVRAKLDAYGFKSTENIFNEWNMNSKNEKSSIRQNHEGAAYVAAAFCVLQASSTDKAMYYDALPTRSYCGLFDFPDQKPTKTFFSFKAFNELYKLGNSVECKSPLGLGVYSCASVSESGGFGAILLANTSDSVKRLKLDLGAKVKSCKLTDANYIFTELNYLISADNVLSIPEKSMIFLEVELH